MTWVSAWPGFVVAVIVIPALWTGGVLFFDKRRSRQVQPRIEMRRVSTPAGVPVIPGPDPLLSEADFERLSVWLADQPREESR